MEVDSINHPSMSNYQEHTLQEISQKVYHALESVFLDKEQLKENLKKLAGYCHIDELFRLERGRYIRWVSYKKGIPFMTNGGIVLDMKFTDTGTHILCKTNNARLLQVKFDSSVIFQQLSYDEKLILTANGLL